MVKGYVNSSVSDEVLISATLLVGDIGAYTDIDGSFSFTLPAGEYTIEASYVGYESLSQTVVVTENEIAELNFVLFESATLLETATVTGSRYEQRLAEATVSIQVLKPDIIESTNTVALDDVLEKVPGVQFVDDQVNIRGGSGFSYGAGSRVLLMVDDMPALQVDAGLPQWNDIPVENISQIEVVKGAASALHGSAALNGIINVRTGYATSKPVTKVSMHYTSFMDPKDPQKKWWTNETPFGAGASIMHKRKFKKLDLVAGGFIYTINSFNQDVKEDRGRININTRYRMTDRFNFGINSFFTHADNQTFFLWKNATTGALQPDPITISSSNNYRFMIDPFVNWYDRKGNKHRFQSRIYYIDNSNNLDQSNSSTTYYGEYQFHSGINPLDVKFTTGLSAMTTLSEAEYFRDSSFRADNFATFLQLDKEFGEQLNLTAGIRYEYNKHKTPTEFLGTAIPEGKIDESKLIMRFGMNYELSEGTFLRASYGQGYRFPTLVERFLRTTFSSLIIFENPLLESETGWNVEYGLKQGFKLLNFQGFFDVSAFWSEYDNMMEFTFQIVDGQAGFQSQNVGDTRIRGLELSVSGQSTLFNIPIKIIGGYTYIDPVYKNWTFDDGSPNSDLQSSTTSDENILKYRTKHSFTFDAEAAVGSLFIGLALKGASHMVAIDNLLSNYNNIALYRDANDDGFRVWDARVAYQRDWWKLSLLANNFLNEEYTSRPALMEAPRNIALRVDLTL
jgi:iron complex outermembrane receptor protein